MDGSRASTVEWNGTGRSKGLRRMGTEYTDGEGDREAVRRAGYAGSPRRSLGDYAPLCPLLLFAFSLDFFITKPRERRSRVEK